MRGKIRKEKLNPMISKDDSLNRKGQSPHANPSARTFDEYQCSGNVEVDFAALCNLLGIKYSPSVLIKGLAHTRAKKSADGSTNTNAAPSWSKRCLQVELDNEDPLTAKSLKIFGWKVDDHIIKILQKMLPSLSKLQKMEFSLAGLTDRAVASLLSSVPLCAHLRFLTVEGNPLSEQSYQLLLSESSSLTHLALKNNRMGDGGARLIGSALSTISSTNKKLLALNLSFNSIGDEGAAHIAQGLRLNRTLVCLSLSNNQIGDVGATQLARILGEFALTHEEAEERIKLMERKAAEPVELLSPLLDTQIQLRDGELMMPGNTTLVSLNLSGNKMTEKSLPVFLKSLEVQSEGGGLLRLRLQRNGFSPGCDDYVKIKEVMAPREDAFEKLRCEETDTMKKEA
ncbi:leucine-rich repeat-containing protein 71 isoform X1 [Takifugu rubripes]|uniref:Leucine rich repeat containing 71 n=1 Tax=Takifugu rubripes TaxID=31033 RepID=A0A674P7G3_TAKRU|nr:leucine-rich repeat-containing protein 71-like isoform X1 [Takifugu rubripes]XP_029701460.1 leucine-rich repeat-containing protein 71-like isoform X1 [Takifugu rubripes]